jgi:hypothetical protein
VLRKTIERGISENSFNDSPSLREETSILARYSIRSQAIFCINRQRANLILEDIFNKWVLPETRHKNMAPHLNRLI